MRILDHFETFLLEDEQREKHSHYASGVGACTRQQWYAWKSVEQTDAPDAGARLKMRMGKTVETVFEEFIAWAVERGVEIGGYRLIDFDREARFSHEVEGLRYPINGRVDYLLMLEGFGTVGVELKSMYGRGIAEIQKSQRPKDDYLRQIFIYTETTGIKHWLHPYIGRDNGYRTEFWIERVEDGLLVNGRKVRMSFENAVEKLKRVEAALDHDAPPVRDFWHAIKNGEMRDEFTKDKVKHKSDWQCRYCAWKRRCWEPIAATMASGDNLAMKGEQDG